MTVIRKDNKMIIQTRSTMTDSKMLEFLEELTRKRPSYSPGGFSVDPLNTNIHIGGGKASVYIRSPNRVVSVAVGHGDTLREALSDAHEKYVRKCGEVVE